MTYNPQLFELAFDDADEMRSALPTAPVVDAGPPRYPLRRRAAAGLHRLADLLE